MWLALEVITVDTRMNVGEECREGFFDFRSFVIFVIFFNLKTQNRFPDSFF
jgi:hypothetical protein